MALAEGVAALCCDLRGLIAMGQTHSLTRHRGQTRRHRATAYFDVLEPRTLSTSSLAPGASTAVAGIAPTHLAVGDFSSHDGDLDIVATDTSGSNVYIVPNNGDGTFNTPSSLSGVTSPK